MGMTRRLGTLAAVTGILMALGVPAARAIQLPAGETEVVSVSNGGEVGDLASSTSSISADGRFVAFASSGTNLVGAPNGNSQIYLRDLTNNTTALISQAGGAPGNGASFQPSISADGGVVAYLSGAGNLADPHTAEVQALVWSRSSGTTSVVSLDSAATPSPANAAITDIVVSGDGKIVAFTTSASNLTTLRTFGADEVYVRDIARGVTTLVSADPNTPDSASSAAANEPALSGDGSMVAFTGGPGLVLPSPANVWQVYVRNMTTSALSQVSIDASGTRGGNASSKEPTISRDGNIIAFTSFAADLTDVPLGAGIYYRDMRTGGAHLASPDADTGLAANGAFRNPALSSSGSSVAFSAASSSLTHDGASYADTQQVYVRSISAGTTSLASVPVVEAGSANAEALWPSLSGDGRLVTFTSAANNLIAGIGTSPFAQIYLHDTATVPRVERIGGTDRFAVSAAVSAATFGPGVPVAYIASGETFPDALSGSAASGAQRAPVLLVTRAAIPGVVRVELTRLKPQRIVLLGGSNTIDPSVENTLRSYSNSVSRIAGADRFEVSAAISAATFGLSGQFTPVAYVASGAVFADALAGSAAAGRSGGPMLLVTKDSVPSTVSAELARLHPGAIRILGGSATVSDSVVAALAKIAPTTRVAGVDRFALSAGISAETFSVGTPTVYIASGAVFPDALSGSAAAVRRVAPVLLVTADQIPDPIKAELTRLKPSRIIILGGPATVTDAVLNELRAYAVVP